MRYFPIAVVLCVFALEAYAVDLTSFHNKNFESLQREYCGLHLRVSGNLLTTSEIVPPSRGKRKRCRTGRYGICKGQSSLLMCYRTTGRCYVLSLREDGEFYRLEDNLPSLILRSDGSIFIPKFGNPNFGNVLVDSGKEEYHICG